VHRLIADGYQDADALRRRAAAMQRWLERPSLLRADPDATYAAVLDIDLATITEPLVACPDDPDDVRPLSAVAGTPVDEVFIGSCMTNVGHFQRAAEVLARPAPNAAPAPRRWPRLWLAPPTAMAEAQLRAAGHYATFAAVGARTELPGCSLCMGNQARVAPGATVVSTSTRNYPGRMGDGAAVHLASAEVAAVAARLGALPTVEQYRAALDAAAVAHT
jgi:aconitate hydratase 2/2-methylisocitrate dehydratase